MADNGDDAGEGTGGFVFGDERVTDDENGADDGFNTGVIAVAVVLVVVVVAVVVLATIVQPFGDLGSANTAPDAGTATVTETANGTDGTETGISEGGTPADNATTPQRTSVSSTPPATSVAQPPTATPTQTPTATATPTDSATTESGTTPSGERSPVIEAFTVTDRSDGGTATFDVAWNVSDPNRDLVSVRVSLVADPDGEARIIERRRFDAGGARSAGSTTFSVDGGAGEVYAVRIEVLDGSGNTAFQLTRVVADGSPDG